MFYVVAVVWGIVAGAFAANQLAVIYELCELRLMALLLGLNLFASGLGALAGTPLCSKYNNVHIESLLSACGAAI